MRPPRSEKRTSLTALPCLVLAGGLGMRLRPVFRQGPKCMAPVAGRPFLSYLLQWLSAAGIRNVILCVGYQRARILDWLARERPGGMWLRYSKEDRPLGTAGALRKATRLLRAKRVLVLNGDSFLDVNLKALVSFHRRRKARATLALARVGASSRYGVVQIDARGAIRAFIEKAPTARGARRAGMIQYVNGGVYVLEKSVLDFIPRDRQVSLERDIFPRLVGKRLYGFPVPGYFIDIGVPVDYKKARRDLPRRFAR